MAGAAEHSGSQLHGPVVGLRGHSTYQPCSQLQRSRARWTQEPGPHLQRWVMLLTLIRAPSPYGQSTIPVSVALQATPVEFPEGSWRTLSPPARGVPPLPGVRLEPVWAGGGALEGEGSRPIPITKFPSPSPPPLLLRGWQMALFST